MDCRSCGAALAPTATSCASCGATVDFILGRTLNEKYHVTKKLGEGGFGAVYQAEEPRLKRQVAIKTLHPRLSQNKAVTGRFLQEGIAASKLDHPSAVKIYDTGETKEGHLWIAMEFLQGRDLAAYLKEKGRVSPEEMMSLLGPILEVLGEAHQKHLIHRDLKPQNIMLTSVSGKPIPKLLDFGISKMEDADTQTQEGSMMGTPQFMPPEQWGKANEVVAASDVYALGIIVFLMLSGVLPFEADSPKSWMKAHCLERPRPLAPLLQGHPKAADIEKVVLCALDKDPQKRYPTALELKRALEEACSSSFASSAETQAATPSPLASGVSCARCDIDHTRGSSECPANRIGHVVAGKYKLLRLMGTGGMGAVYEAEHIELRQKIAVKLLHPRYAKNEAVNKRFQEEARRAVSLKHPGIIEVMDLGRDTDGSSYLTMELLRGKPLSDLLKEGPLSIEQALEITSGALEALSVAHQKGIVHRDLKPENIFYAADSQGKLRAKILDFGISKALDSDAGALTQEGSMIGTPVYMSLEQATDSSKVDHRSDVYSMGATLFELLTNKHPVSGKTINELLTRLANDEVERHPKKLRPDLPDWLDRVVSKAMAQRPEERYQSADEMLSQLKGAAPLSLQEESPRPTSKPKSILPWLGLAAVGVVALGFLFFQNNQEKPSIKPKETPVSQVNAPTSQPMSAPQEPKTLAAPAQETLTLEVEAVQVEKKGDSIIKDRFLTSGDSIKNGDYFEMNLTVSEDAYIYVVVLSSEGHVAVLLPQDGDLLLKKGETKRLPEEGEYGFDISGESGYENLYIIAAKEPLSKTGSEVAKLIADIREGKLPAVTPEKLREDVQPPKGLLDARAIGVSKIKAKVNARGAQAKVTEAKVTEQGLALVHLWFKHL